MRTSAVFTTPGPTNVRFRTRAQDMTLVGDWSAPMPYTLMVTADTWRDLLTNLPPTPISGSYTDWLATNVLQFYRMKVER